MRFKLIKNAFIVSLVFSLTSCKEWLEFDLSRYAFGFISSLVIGGIGLIIMAINNGNKKK
tara:strand:+ start:957 stop:1136 length:180 start_codon:yes stop_codon:yes gene_type:complete